MRKPFLCHLGLHEYDPRLADTVTYKFNLRPWECWHCGHARWPVGRLFCVVFTGVLATCMLAGAIAIYLLT